MLEVPLTQYPKTEDLFCRTASWSEACLFFCNDWFCLSLQPVEQHLQLDLTWVAYQADCAVVLALLKVTLLEEGDNKRRGAGVHGMSHFPTTTTATTMFIVFLIQKCEDINRK